MSPECVLPVGVDLQAMAVAKLPGGGKGGEHGGAFAAVDGQAQHTGVGDRRSQTVQLARTGRT